MASLRDELPASIATVLINASGKLFRPLRLRSEAGGGNWCFSEGRINDAEVYVGLHRVYSNHLDGMAIIASGEGRSPN
jgi:hypothetical protein